MFQPCEKTAVAIRIDPEDGGYYTVCAYHSREPMVPLLDVLIAWEKQRRGHEPQGYRPEGDR